MPMPTFWDLLQQVKDETGATEAWILRRSELNHGAFTAWRSRGIPVLPLRRQLLLLADAMKVDYEFLIEVILHDAGYLPKMRALREEGENRRWLSRSDPVRPPKSSEAEQAVAEAGRLMDAARKERSTGRAKRRQQDKEAEAGGA